MNVYDYIVLAIVAAALICAVVFMVRRCRKNETGCSCGCSCCHMSGSCREHVDYTPTESNKEKQ